MCAHTYAYKYNMMKYMKYAASNFIFIYVHIKLCILCKMFSKKLCSEIS